MGSGACYSDGMDVSATYDAVIGRLVQKYPQWKPEAYDFLRQAMDLASDVFATKRDRKHLSAQELYLGCCMHAHEVYGPMAKLVLSSWGVYTVSDVGSLVYNLIAEGVFSKQKEDRREEFDELPDLEELLDEPYMLTLDDMEDLFEEDSNDIGYTDEFYHDDEPPSPQKSSPRKKK